MRKFIQIYTPIFFTILTYLFLISCDSAQKTKNSSTESSVENTGTTINIGLISNQIQNDMRLHKPFMEYLYDSLSHFGVSDVGLVVTRSIDSMLVKIENGNIDISFDSPYPTKLLIENNYLEIALRQQKAGADYYGSYIFTKHGSGITKLEDLKGNVIGFEKRYSTTGYYLPSQLLKNAGYKLCEVDEPGAKVDNNEIGFIYTDDDENTIYWVLRDKLIAGATDNISFEQYLKDKTDQLRIIHETKKVPRHLVSIKTDLNPQIKNRLINLLLEMHKNERGKTVLKEFYGTAKFDLLSIEDLETISSL